MSIDKKGLTREKALELLEENRKKLLEIGASFAKEIVSDMEAQEKGCTTQEYIMYIFARDVLIKELAKNTGKTEQKIEEDKELKQELQSYCGLFVIYITKELDKTEYRNIKFNELVIEDSEKDKSGNSFVKPGSRLHKLLDIATTKTMKIATEEAKETPERPESSKRKKEKPKDFIVSVAKVPDTIWCDLFKTKEQIPGQMGFIETPAFNNDTKENTLKIVNVGRKSDPNRENVIVLYEIDQSELKQMGLSKEIDSFDQRVHDAMCTLYDIGYRVVTTRQIYFAMGYINNPNPRHNKDIQESIMRLSGTKLTVDETNDYPTYISDNYIIKAHKRIVDVKIKDIYSKNGEYLKSEIYMTEEPVLLEFSRRRKQLETIPLSVLQYKGYKTPDRIAVENYIARRISLMIGGKRDNNKNTIYEIAHKSIIEAVGKKAKPQRTIDKAIEFLDNCVKTGWIKGWKPGDNKFIIELQDEQ